MPHDSDPSPTSDPLTAQLQADDWSRSVWADILTPTAQAALLASAALAGTGVATVPQIAQAQISFDDGTALPTGADAAASSVGDFDGDDDLDLLVIGDDGSSESTTVYENTDENMDSGSLDGNTFQAVGAGLSGVGRGSTVVGDFDGDGDLDLLVTGRYATGENSDEEDATLYENTDQNSGTLDADTFQEVGAGIDGVQGSSVEAVDFDGDGDLDLLVAGFDGSEDPGETTTLYENTDQNSGTLDANTFQAVGAGLTGFMSAGSAVGDLDGDGDLDLLLLGSTDAQGRIVEVYENTGQNAGDGTLDANTFEEVGAGLTGVYRGTISVEDFDGDGDLDLFVAGAVDASTRTAKIYENTGQNQGDGTLDANTFDEVTTNFTEISFASSAVGDFDGDGDIDLLATGATGGLYGEEPTAVVYENTDQNSGVLDDSTFQDASAGLTAVSDGSSSVGDFDGDLDLDLLVTGQDGSSNPSAMFYDNTSNNPIPVELTDFSARRDGPAALLSWQTASEQNNAGFEVQRLVGTPGSGTYESMGFVDGAGTTDRAQSYRFRTDDLRVGTHRFRLKQVDTDGSAEYSDPVSLDITIAETHRLSAPTPNPVTQGTQIRLAVEQTQAVTVGVYDLMGREVATVFDRTLSAQSERSIRVDTEGLPAGTYFLRVDGERFRATERLTVVK